jgi:ATP-dependent Lon protease
MQPSLKLPERLVVPVFPLPNAILFPGARLPLYIFEPRYKTMIDDSLASHHYLSVALDRDLDGQRKPAEISGLGQITHVEQLPKNEKNIVVLGLSRVRLLRNVSLEPYITAEVEPLEATFPDGKTEEQLFPPLRDAVKSWLFRMRAGNVRQLAELGSVCSVAQLCDFFGAHLLDDAKVRQQLLEELDVEKRARMIIHLVETELYRYSAPFEN